ncbi:MAG: ATP-binding protein [Cellulosilyticaceae bacterium]
MSIGQFLRDKWLFCMMQIGVVLFIGMMLSVFRLSGYSTLFVCSTVVVLDTLLLLGEYIQKRIYYKRLACQIEQLDKKTLITEVAQKPEFEEAKIWWEILQVATKSMNDEIAHYRVSQEAYKTYIEAWIHEIKTPIACIELMCENQKNTVTKGIGVETKKIEDFVEQALFYARSTSVEKDYVIKEVSLETVVRAAIKKEATRIIEGRVKVELESLDYRVLTDSKWLAFMLTQILCNSLRYKGEALTLRCEARDEKERIVLRIGDNGIGICESDIGRVFDKGFTGENGRRYGKSTGIGLYLCQKLCDKMHLGITLTSKLGEGTTVELIFPKDKRIFFED